ncbi:MAG: alpha/beta hydrolase [Candidatus Pelagadaptatus aseana]
MAMLGYTKALHEQPPEKCRKTYLLLDKLFGGNKSKLPAVFDRLIDTDGDPMALRIYKSERAIARKDNPCLVYFHGGGGVIGDLDTHDGFCREVAAQSDFVVVSVDYRRAPEFPFPVPVEDSIRGWNWVCDNAQDLGIDLSRTGVGGDSAGGYMATCVCQQVKLRSLSVVPQRMPAYQWLIYPMLDCRLETPSTKRCTEGMVLTRADMAYFFDHLLPPPLDRADRQVSPGLNPDLQGLPKTYLITAGFDPLEDEGKNYATALAQQGVEVDAEHVADVMHGFIGFVGVCPTSATYVRQLIEKLTQQVV